MKEILSNSWVISIISGILVFFITNTFIMFQNRRKHKKQITDANLMILNRLRGYIVDNGLPQKEVINAVKASTSREYDIRYDELLNIKELCEELITDIIGNIYISNDNKVKYINMLKDYLNEKSNLQEDIFKNTLTEVKNTRKKIVRNSFFEIILSCISAIVAFIVVFFGSLNTTGNKLSNINSNLSATISTILIILMFIFILPEIKSIIKWFKKHKK